MDLPILCLALFSITLLLLLLVKNSRNKRNKTFSSNFNIPPGPRKLPIIGNIHNLVGSLPHRKLQDLAKKYGSLMHLQLGEVSTIVVSSPEYAKEVMKTHDVNFSTRPPIIAAEIMSYNCTNIAFAPYGNYWRQLRKICTLELLSLKRVNSFQAMRKEELTNLVKKISLDSESKGLGVSAQPFNLSRAVLFTIFTIVSRAAFGKKCKEHDEFVTVVKEALRVAGGFEIGDLFPSAKWLQNLTGMRPKLEKLQKQSDQILETIINDHNNKNESKVMNSEDGIGDEGQDIVDVLLKYEDGDNPNNLVLTKDNMKGIILDIFGGGGETATTTIDWAMAEMVRNPRIMKKAQLEVRKVFDPKGKVDENQINELKYLKMIVKETLRLHPPAPLLLPRECGKTCEINGYHIKTKCKIIINAWVIGRDPNHWTEPERFWPERFVDCAIDYKGSSFEYIPFGAGRRICPGITFGMRNVELALAFLLYHFDWKLPLGMKNEELDMSEDFGVTARRKDDLLLFPIAYRPLPLT